MKCKQLTPTNKHDCTNAKRVCLPAPTTQSKRKSAHYTNVCTELFTVSTNAALDLRMTSTFSMFVFAMFKARHWPSHLLGSFCIFFFALSSFASAAVPVHPILGSNKHGALMALCSYYLGGGLFMLQPIVFGLVPNTWLSFCIDRQTPNRVCPTLS